MLDRRMFLGAAGAAVGTALLPISAGAMPLGLPPGLQLWTVKEDLAKDFAGTLKSLKAIGYDRVEAAGWVGLSPADFRKGVAAAGLDLSPMGTAEHYHPTLAITIDDQPVPVPPNIGVDPDTGAMSAVHTHEGDGTIHIEAHTVGEKFTLGQLFTQWGVALTPTQIGGVKANAGEEVRATSNGAPVTGDPGDLELEPEQEIELTLP